MEFFNKYSTVLIRSWASVDVESPLYALMYAILYRGLGHLDFGICGSVLEPVPLWILRDTKVFGSQKLYADFFGGELVPQPLCFLRFSGTFHVLTCLIMTTM